MGKGLEGHPTDVKELSYKNFESKSQPRWSTQTYINDVKELSYKNFESKSQLFFQFRHHLL